MSICIKTFKEHRLEYRGTENREDTYICLDCGEMEIHYADTYGG
jgi:hypothetical protein